MEHRNEIPADMNPHYAAGYAQYIVRQEQAGKTFSYNGVEITVTLEMTLSDVEKLFEAAGGGK